MPQEPQPSSIFTENGGKLSRETFLSRLAEAQGNVSPSESPPVGEEPTGDQEIASLLEDPPEGAAPEKAPEAPRESDKPATLEAVAEKLGIETKDLYALAIPMPGDGESRTLGQLKDAYEREVDIETRSLELEERRVSQDAALLRAKQDLQIILSSLPKDAIKPEILARAHAEADAYRRNEDERLRELVPEWADENTESDERAAISAQLADYGFPADYLDSIADHRMVVYMRDNAKRAERVKKALEQAKVERPRPRAQQPSTRQPPRPTGQRVEPSQNLSPSQLRRKMAGLNRG